MVLQSMSCHVLPSLLRNLAEVTIGDVKQPLSGSTFGTIGSNPVKHPPLGQMLDGIIIYLRTVRLAFKFKVTG